MVGRIPAKRPREEDECIARARKRERGRLACHPFFASKSQTALIIPEVRASEEELAADRRQDVRDSVTIIARYERCS